MSRPELETLIDQFRTADVLGLPSVEAMRAALDQIGELHPVAQGVECVPASVAGVAAEWITAPTASRKKAFLYLHGGGYVIGSIKSHRSLVAALSSASGISGLALDFRRAPEDPFPAALEDATAAYRYLVEELGVNRVVLAGDSAGGGLVLATLVHLRDSGDPMPPAAICISPWTDLEVLGESFSTRAHLDPMCHRPGILRLARLYLGGRDPKTPLASPLHADLRGLPPLMIHVGEAETLYDDSARIAARAQAAGVKVILKEWKAMPHVFPLFAPDFPESRQSVAELGQFLAAHIG